MLRDKFLIAFLVLVALLLTGCSAGTLKRADQNEAVESASADRYSGAVSREVRAVKGQRIDYNVAFSAKGGHILITITDCNGNNCLSLNVRASLADHQPTLVSVPAGGQPYILGDGHGTFHRRIRDIVGRRGGRSALTEGLVFSNTRRDFSMPTTAKRINDKRALLTEKAARWYTLPTIRAGKLQDRASDALKGHVKCGTGSC